jgi:hypothetical protein
MRTIKFEIKNPFMCHAGQFEGGRTLVIGVRKAFLDEDAILNVRVGSKVYQALTSELRAMKTTPHKAKGGVALEIMPLYYFEIIQDDKKVVKEPEIIKEKEVSQQTLL